MDNFNITTDDIMNFVTTFGPKLLAAVATLVIGLWIVKFIVRGTAKVLNRSSVDEALVSFLRSLISMLLKVMVYISALGMLGIEMTSFIAVLGAAGLAIGLALQGSLSNFAGGVLILFFKPFKVGDFIERGSESGTVEKIDILHTHLQTPNNQLVVIPNGQLANSPVTNYSAKETRRAVFPVGIGYGSDVKKAREVILRVLNEDERILQEPAPIVVLTNLGDSSLDLSARAWTKTENYWGFFWDNLEKIKEELDKEGIEIPFPQRDIHVFQEKE
ncbi:mechanosensitive ion channel family protein [Gracilimonas sp. BCB1]|uniref:mechanosensitive ion channel family protein n=1 Tax=Gracilimonas sp. BCB1 TaxID=3152362 RepID=UPI0032D987BD